MSAPDLIVLYRRSLVPMLLASSVDAKRAFPGGPPRGSPATPNWFRELHSASRRGSLVYTTITQTGQSPIVLTEIGDDYDDW